MNNFDNWEKSKQRYEAFWAGKVIDRPLMAVQAPMEGATIPPLPKSLNEKWLDIEFREKELKFICDHTYYGGDSFPYFFSNLGPGITAACIGGGFVLGEDTVWFDTEQIISS